MPCTRTPHQPAPAVGRARRHKKKHVLLQNSVAHTVVELDEIITVCESNGTSLLE